VRKSLLKRLMKRLAIPSGRQIDLHSHSAKSPSEKLLAGHPKDGDISQAISLVMLKLLSIVAALMMSTSVFAVGMGGINVASALGQPLKADIDLVAINKAEKDSLVARLASPEAYKSAGLEYPYGNKFKFQIESRADGQAYIKASSVEPVNDPFVSLLVELTWSSGKLSREYTFLLDPPGYVSEQPTQEKVQVIAPAVAESAVPEEVKATPAEQAVPIVTITPVEQAAPAAETAAKPAAAPAETAAKPVEQAAAPVATTPKPVKQAAPMEATIKPVEQAAPKAAPKVAAVKAKQEKLEVKRGDTMYKIAEQYKPADMSLERMVVAIYRVNSDQFDGQNMNRIRAGKILHMPTQQELMSVSQPEAVKEIHAQVADWNAYRQKLASAASVSNQSQTAKQVATGKISSSIADRAPVAKESAKEVLKLSKGEAPGDKVGTASGKPMTGQNKKNAAQEDAIAQNKALQEGEKRTAILEKNLKDMQRLAQLKAEAAALAKPPGAAVPKAAVSEVPATSAVKPTPIAPKPMQVKPEPSMLDQVLDEPLYRVGGAVALLALGGLGFMLYRRRKNPSVESTGQPSEDLGDITGRIAAPILPSPETGDFTVTTATQAVTDSQSDSVDPISEADLFLNFGRDVQAEEILKEALQTTPNNYQIHLKLLGIYANRKDTNSFSTIARLLQDSGDNEAWQQAVAMGRKLDPNNPLYGGAGTKEDAGSATMQMKAFDAPPEPENVLKPQASALDFDFDVSASTADEVAPSPEQDFLSSAEKTMILSPDGSLSAQGEKMDFDITSSQSAMPAASGQGGKMDFDITSTNPSMIAVGAPIAAMPISDDVVFDVTSSQSFRPAAQSEIIKPAEPDGGGMAFALDFPVENTAEKSGSVPQPAASGLAGISLNLDDSAAPSGSTTESKDDHWQEVATKLDLAKAYHEMGDASGAREILEEVLREGDAEQRGVAQTLFDQLG
jgi:pilus assembly protein FimV